MGHSINVLVLDEASVMISRNFISVPTKLIVLIVLTLFFISAGFSVMSLDRLQDEVQSFRQNSLIQGQSELNVQNGLLRSKLTGWLELYTEIIELKEQDNFDALIKGLNQQFAQLQLNLNVENLWLVNNELQPLFSTTAMADYIIKNATKALLEEEPQDAYYCLESCQQLISLPVMNNKGEIAIVVISASLVDTLYALNRDLKADVAIVSFDGFIGTELNSATIISAFQPRLLENIFYASSTSLFVEEVKANGLKFDFDSSHYLLNLIPLVNNQRHYYLAIVDDITSFQVANDGYRQRFFIWVIILLYLLSVLVYLLASPFTQRLLILSNALPLLAKKEFAQFRQIKLYQPSLFRDELDVLTDATITLSLELEQLNLAVNQKTKALEHMAMYDRLTGLPNRHQLNEHLGNLITGLKSDKKGIAVLFLDLDDFKKVNDSYGHSEGDQLLLVVAHRLLFNKNINFICHFGADEFVMILSELTSSGEAEAVAKQIVKQFREPIKLPSIAFYVPVSIGIVYSEDETAGVDQLISRADIAMYQAKDNGGDQYQVYYEVLYQKIAHRVILEADVRKGLTEKQFSVSLQPQFYPISKKIYGFEALLRWNHPERGLLSPDDFISALKSSANMILLGYWVIRRCFELFVAIRTKGLKDAHIAINLSSIEFTDPGLIEYFHELLVEFDLQAEHFQLEITESVLIKNLVQAGEIMNRLKSMGFTLAIDDFGTGYASLSYLKKIPVDIIKLDKCLVIDMEDNLDDYDIVMSTIAMVNKLGLTVIACGVESHQQLLNLTESNCDVVQGNYLFKPVHEDAVVSFIDEYIFEGNFVS